MESSPFDGIEVIIGTYEHYVVGYWLKSSSDSKVNRTLFYLA